MIKIEMSFISASAAAAALQAVAALSEKLGGEAFDLQAATMVNQSAVRGVVAGNAQVGAQASPDPKPERAAKPPKAEPKATPPAPGPGPSTSSSKTSGEPAAEGVTYEALQAAVFKLANKDRAKAKALMDEFCGAGNTFKVYIDKTDAERVKPMAAVEAALAEAGAA